MVWIIENQLHRRNLNETQRGMIAYRMASLKQGARTDLSPIGGMSQAQAAKALNVGERTLQRAGVVSQQGSPGLIEASMSGLIPASVGELITALSHEEQDRLAEQCMQRGDAKPARTAAANVRRARKRATTAAPDINERQHFAVVLADPWRDEGTRFWQDREITDHRCLVAPDKIKKVGKELAKHLLPAAVLFLRVPGPKIQDALHMLEVWGFEYRAQLVCPNPGTESDDFLIYEHQLLLIGDKGDDLLPAPTNRPKSVIIVEVHQVIEKMYPELPKLALFTHIERSGWTSWPDGPGAAENLSMPRRHEPIPAADEVNLD
jgi:hypothetical protein